MSGLFVGHARRRDLHLRGAVDDLDVLVAEGAHHVVHLVGSRHVGRERVVDLFVGEEALALARLDELLDFLAVAILRSCHFAFFRPRAIRVTTVLRTRHLGRLALRWLPLRVTLRLMHPVGLPVALVFVGHVGLRLPVLRMAVLHEPLPPNPLRARCAGCFHSRSIASSATASAVSLSAPRSHARALVIFLIVRSKHLAGDLLRFVRENQPF